MRLGDETVKYHQSKIKSKDRLGCRHKTSKTYINPFLAEGTRHW